MRGPIAVRRWRVGVMLGVFLPLSGAMRPPVPQTTDLDQFMAEVLGRRDENWRKLQQYLLDERERFQVLGPSGVPMWGDERRYTWFIRDGFFVRSPLSANGVEISEDDRRKAEDEFLRRVRARDPGSLPAPPPPDTAASDHTEPPVPGPFGGLLSQSRAPQFVDKAYFLRFKFERGRYAFVGRETLGGADVLRIEYYPERLFSHEQESQDRRRQEGRRDSREDAEAARERMMNRASLVTLWVEPRAKQIVKYTFDNVALDFLPAAWLLRVNDLEATMTMGEPFAGVWLPSEITLQMEAMLATGPIDVSYRVTYENYREARGDARVVPIGPQ